MGGHLAADIRRAVARLDRAVILWGQRALEDGDWSGAAAAAAPRDLTAPLALPLRRRPAGAGGRAGTGAGAGGAAWP